METEVRYSLGNFDVFYKALTLVGAPLPAVSPDFEGEGPLDFNDLDWFSVVDFCHALNFDEFHKVTFLISVALIFVHGDHSVFILGDGHNNERLGSLAVVVCDNVAVAVV